MAEFTLTPNNDIFPPDTLTNIFGDDIITGLAGDDSIDGGDGVDSLAGGDGNDTLIGGPAGTSTVIGSDTLDGGNGTDLADYLGTSGGVTVNLTDGTASSAPDITFNPISQILISIENVRGSNFDDTIQGDSGDNILDGAAGNDSVVGGAGNDILAGGTGNNTLDGGDGNDWADYLSSVSNISVNLETGTAFDIEQTLSDTLSNIENIRGSTFGDTLQGNTGDNILEGGGGADSLQAGLGNDLYRLNSTTAGGSQINDAGGTDTLNFTDDVSIALAAPTSGVIGLARDGTTLLLDTNQDGNANASDDLAIIDFFNASLNGAGTGFIESVQNLSGTDILGFFFGSIQFSAPSFTVQEDGTVVQAITVTRTGGSSGTVTATVNLTDGTATAPGDYNNTPLTVTFADGDTAAKTVTVPIVQDTLVEGTETVNLTLANVTGGAVVGTQNTATLNINDDDTLPAGTLQFSAPSFTVQEDGTVVQAITVTRTGGSSGAVTATVNLTDGTATAPGDYDNTPLTVTFADGDTAAKTVTVPIVQDTLFEGTETVNLTLSTTSAASIGTQNTATLNISDDDPANPGNFSFDAPTVSVNETSPVAVVSINRTGGTDGAVSLLVNLRDGTATAGLDYVNAPSPAVVTFADGDAEPKPVSIPILDDNLVEGNETISVELTDVSGSVTGGVVSSLILEIVDNDVAVLPGTLEFSAPTFSTIEGKPTAEITVNRTGGSDGPISANLVFTEGTAKAGVSFNASPIPVTFADGDATAKRVRIPIFDDAVVEDLPTFNVALADVTGGATVGAQSNAAVQIANNDAAPLTLPLLGFEEFGNFQRFTSSGGLTFSDNAITLLAENQGGEGRFRRDIGDSRVVAYDTGDSITVGLTDRLSSVPGGISGGQISFRYASPNQSHQVRFFDAAGNQVGVETLNRTPGDRDNFSEFVNASFNFPSNTRSIALGSTATQIGFDDIEVTLNPTLLTGEWQYTAPQDFTFTGDGFSGLAPAFAAPLDIIQTGDTVTISGFYLNSTGTGSGQISGNQITATLPLSGGTGQLVGSISADGRTIQGNITFTSSEPGSSTATIPFTMSSQTGAGNDVITGDGGTNSLSAGIGNDSLTGGVGADTLTGGDGSDDFIFNNSGEGSDIITDFTPGEDQIVIAAAGFGADITAGAVLPASGLALGTSASDPNQRFIYDSATGGLFFDGDGNGPSSQVQLATLTGVPGLNAGDILVL